jgi:branched-chain amino acid transport system substrate-binding protein
MRRRTFLGAAAGGLAAPLVARAAGPTPGVTKDSIKIGQTMPYSGPASAYGVIGQTEAAFFKMLNAQGGINGRKIELLSADDGYSPPRTVEETRRLVEAEGVAFMYQGLGTASQSAVQRYLNQKKVPQLFVASGAEKWADPEHFPWTMGWQPSYRTEAVIYARHIMQVNPAAKLAVLYQNDDFGKDYLTGLRDGLGAKYDAVVIKAVSYEVTDPTVDSQIVTLQNSGADALVTAATPKFAAQTIKKMAEIGWHPAQHYLTNVSLSASSVMIPAGAENGKGIMSGAYQKEQTDPQWANDPGMNQLRSWAKQWAPEMDLANSSVVYAYGNVLTLKKVLEECGDDLSRENIMREAANLHDLEIPILLPGIKINTSPKDFHPIEQLQLAKWTGSAWQLFGEVMSGA